MSHPSTGILFLSLLTGIFMQTAVPAQNPPRERILLDRDWRFKKADPPPAGKDTNPSSYSRLKSWILPAGNAFLKDPSKHFTRPAGNPGEDTPYTQIGFSDLEWEKVNLPHDWAIAGPFNIGGADGAMGRLPVPGIGWYRKRLDIPASAAGKSLFLEIDGAMSYATVWLNGRLVGGWPYGYASWQLDLTPYVVPGRANQLAIRLENPCDSSRWYSGAGLYRHVWLIETQSIHVGEWGTFVTTPRVSSDAATIDLKATVDNDAQADAVVNIDTAIYPLNADGKTHGNLVAAMKTVTVTIPARGHSEIESSAVVLKPRLWGPVPTQKPNRYIAVTTISRQGAALDRYETPFGIRRMEYKPDGLYLNGERIRIQGVNLHHDLGALGAAFNVRAAERQLQELQEMGCNAIRTSHNPPAPELLELTDRMGFLVLDEIFDAWVRQKTPFDFHLLFPEWHEQDLRAFIRRDRNHPSVFLWSVGNEVGEQDSGETGAKVARELVSIAHDEDRTRPVTASMNAAAPDSSFAVPFDVISLNYQGEGVRDIPAFANTKGMKKPPEYDAFRKEFPKRLMIASETAATFSSRDTYLFPVAPGLSNPATNGKGSEDSTRQVSSYEIYAADFGSSPDRVFAAQDQHPFVGGEFVWSGWDYLGEPTPYYSSRSSYFGIVDLAGFRKNRFYLYQSRWRPDLPMAHILPHWTWPDRVGKITPVHVFTSGDEAELFLNGKSLGRKKKLPFEYRLCWNDVVYQPGALEVIAYKNGVEWASDKVVTADAPAKLELEADRGRIRDDGDDLSFVTVTVVDSRGIENPRAENRIHFAIQGPGEIVATDNGDATDLEPFPSHDRNAFHGKCLLIIRSINGREGSIRITASAQGLADGNAIVRTSADREVAPADTQHR